MVHFNDLLRKWFGSALYQVYANYISLNIKGKEDINKSLNSLFPTSFCIVLDERLMILIVNDVLGRF